MLKTLVMTTGEFEFDTIFNNDQDLVDEGLSLFLPEVTAIMWVIFIIVMPILFSNLLVSNLCNSFLKVLVSFKMCRNDKLNHYVVVVYNYTDLSTE